MPWSKMYREGGERGRGTKKEGARGGREGDKVGNIDAREISVCSRDSTIRYMHSFGRY